jgi:enediyne biosynthesis protein E4
MPLRFPAITALLALLLPATSRAQEFVQFSEITAEAGISSYGTTFGVALEDLDGDGAVDLFLARTPSMVTEHMALGGTNRLYFNLGDGTFAESGAAAGVASPCENRGLMVADHDNDGAVDLYVTVAGRNELYRNLGDGTFEEVGAAAGVDHWGIGHEGTWLDYDRDGWLDLYFTNGPKEGSLANVLYRNERDGRFRDVSDEAGVAGTVSGKGAALIDFDRDGWLDLLVTNGNDFQNLFLFRNLGDGTFDEVSAAAGLEIEVEETFLSWLIPWDYDNDGWQDVLVGSHSGYYPRNTLFRNQGDGTFLDVTDLVGLRDPFNGDGTAVADLDNDGWLDALFCRLDEECVLYRNVEGEEFEVVDDNAGLFNDAEYPNWTISTGDVDGDGFLDVYLGNGRANHPAHDHLFRNEGNDQHHLFVSVQGQAADRSAIGARVEVTAGDLVQTRWVGSRMTTFSSHGGLRLHFGLAGHELADEVRVTFLDGTEVVYADVAAAQTLHVIETDLERTDSDRDGVPDEADSCPLTPSPTWVDARGCSPFDGGDGTETLVATGPDDGDVAADAVVLSWSGNLDGYVVQLDGDSAFDHDRAEFGPLTGDELELAAEQLEALHDRFGAGRLFWRVVGGTGEVSLTTAPRALHLPAATDEVSLANHDLNIWDPPHVRVEVGDTVTWRVPTEDDGNYNKFRHDVLLTDGDGYVLGRSGLVRPFDGSNEYEYTFDEPGLYHVMCAMHSWPSEESVDLEQLIGGWIEPGPYRCHSGTVTVEEP